MCGATEATQATPKFKVGQKVVLLKVENKYGDDSSDKYTLPQVVRVKSHDSVYDYSVETLDGEFLTAVDERNVRGLEDTDEFFVGVELHRDDSDYNRRIVFVRNGSAVTEDTDDDQLELNTIESLIDDGWAPIDSTELKEVTLSEVAEKFGVDSSKIRIKE